MKIYVNELAFHPGKVRLAIAEKGVTCEQKNLNLFTGENLTPQFLKISPAGTVPVLIDGDKKITQSKEILEYLDSLGEPLGGAGIDKQMVSEWLNKWDAWDGNFFVRAFGPPAVLKLMGLVGDYRIKFAEARLKENPDLAEVYAAKIVSMKADTGPTDPAAKEANQKQLEGLLDEAETKLTTSPWLAGEQYTMADVVFTTVLNRISTAGQTSFFLNTRPKVSEYYNTVKARPSFSKVFSASPTPALVAAGKALLAKVTRWY